jgi:hypothetical protein
MIPEENEKKNGGRIVDSSFMPLDWTNDKNKRYDKY